MRGIRLRALHLAGASVVALVLAGTVAGADGITPGTTTLNLGVGSSATIHNTLHLDAAPAKADVILALDTTGSMGAAITDAKNDANDIVNGIKASIPGAKFSVAEFKDYGDTLTGVTDGTPWRVVQDFTDNVTPIPCGSGEFPPTLSPVECALSQLSAAGGGDEPEAYNTAFYEAYSDPALHFTTGAPRFMVVLGDSLPHDATLNTDFPTCPNTPPTDPGPTGVGALRSQPTLTALKAHNTNLSFVTYNPRAWQGGSFQVGACQGSLAEYTGGSAVTHTATNSLETQIIGLINQAASHVDAVSFTTTAVSSPEGATFDPASWVSFNPPLPYGPISAPADVTYDETITVPQTQQVGTYQFDVQAVADGSPRGDPQHITVNVSNRAVSTITMSADEPSVPAGIAAVPFGAIPASRLASLTPDVGSAAAGSIAAGSIAAGSIASGSIAAGSIAAGSIAAGSIAAGSIAAGSIAAGSIGFGPIASGSIAAGSIPSGGVAALNSVLLSQIPLVGTTWADILKGSPFVDRPLQAVTLYEVATYGDPGTDGKTPWERLMALPLRQVPFFQTLWRSVPFGAILLGNATLDQLPPPKKPDGTRYLSWSEAIGANGGSMDGVTTSTNTVFGLAISGNLGTTAVGSIAAGSIASGSIAAGSIAAGSIAAGSIAAGSIDLRVTHLGTVPLTAVTSLADIVICGGGFNCTGKTLGDASAANAIRPGVTLADLLNHLSPPNDTISIDEIAQAILAVAEYPWEQINVQGLQDIAGTGQNVHYHVDFDLVCTQATGFSVHVKLPKGFFPVAGSSRFSYAGGTPVVAADPTTGANGPVWSTIPGSPCGGGTATRHVRLDFTSYVGLTLGAQASDVDVTPTGTTAAYAATNQAPVIVTQNWEPSGNPDTAPTIDKNTLVVGHVATGDDADFYRFPLTGLAPGTKVIAYLKVPRDADLDLVVNKPGAPGVQSSASGSIAAGSIAAGSIAAGSIAAGSIPIEDVTPGVDNSRGALQPDAAADIASGSIASGSIAAGSISANRGGVNEVAQIVTRGETGAAVIGVSGYNSAFSAENYVLRIKVISPPALPPCPVVTGLGTAAPGSLPTVPTANDPSVKALFLVNRQRLAGLYGATAADSLFGMSSDLTAVASQVGGKVLPIDGNQTVRDAYAAWDQNPCSINAANTVVRSINNLVATYRAKYPNLKYVVLLGTDQALPMWRQQDLTAVSPEIDEANDLAFTTSGLTKGNALYAAAAQNAVLTDGAYGAFKERTWLGHDIPLPEVSVSRVVESPADILGQLHQFLIVNGHLNPATALTTGDSFFADGAAAANASLGVQLPGLTTQDTLLTPTLWTRQQLLAGFFNKSPVPDIGALWAHYSHWTAQPADFASPSGLVTTEDVTTSHPNGTLLFTVGCHSGLNVPDLIASVAAGDQKRLQDWAQTYMQSKSAVYVANTGFGYGDTTTIDLSERLMDHFADSINSGGTIGEQWVRALHRYYSEPSNYDVIDEKVMVEATMYGLPFYDFGTITPHNEPTGPTNPSRVVEGGLDVAHLPAIGASIQQNLLGDGRSLFTDGTTHPGTVDDPLKAGTLSVFYRPIQPTVSRDVTINDPSKIAHGAWIRSLATHTFTDVTPVKSFPLVHSADDAPAKDYPNIFFPAGVVTVNRDFVFGQEQDTAIVNLGKFFPNTTGDQGTEQVVDSIGLDIGYSDSSDSAPPEITQVGAIKTAPGTFTAFMRVTDDAGGFGPASGLNRVAVLYTTGNGAWAVEPLTKVGDGPLWKTGTISAAADSIRLDGEAQDNAGNVGFSFNKAVNFQSVADTGNPTITLDRPLPNAVFTLNDPVLNPLQQVRSSFSCSDPGGVASCLGGSDLAVGQLPSQPSGSFIATGTLGPHTFTVRSTDLAGNFTTKTITYYVVAIFGFKPPVDNPPIVNVLTAGNTTPVKWTLKDAAGNYIRSLSAFTSVSSMAIKCTPGATDPDPDVVPSGLAGLKYDLAGEQFVYNWQTLKSWKGTCRQLVIGLVGNGVLPYAIFQFK